VRILVTGGSGVLGRALLPLLSAAGHEVRAPSRTDLNLYDATAVRAAMAGIQAVYHLATRIPPPETRGQPGAWDENDRLRSGATRLLADAGLETNVTAFLLPSVTFVYPAEGAVDEDTPVTPAATLGSMIAAESQCRRFDGAGQRGVILRLGLLWGRGAESESPVDRYGATLHVQDAGSALAAALSLPSGVYNVVSDGGRVSNARFKAATGWRPAY
jgi:nucleoside-diphosphate-sugar epimerase